MYDWFQYGDIASVAGFLLAHETSAAMALRLRQEKTPDGIRSLTDLSKQTTNVITIGDPTRFADSSRPRQPS